MHLAFKLYFISLCKNSCHLRANAMLNDLQEQHYRNSKINQKSNGPITDAMLTGFTVQHFMRPINSSVEF